MTTTEHENVLQQKILAERKRLGRERYIYFINAQTTATPIASFTSINDCDTNNSDITTDCGTTEITISSTLSTLSVFIAAPLREQHQEQELKNETDIESSELPTKRTTTTETTATQRTTTATGADRIGLAGFLCPCLTLHRVVNPVDSVHVSPAKCWCDSGLLVCSEDPDRVAGVGVDSGAETAQYKWWW